MKLALIVEGDGDIYAIPSLAARIGVRVGTQVIAPRPIKAGGIHKLKCEGQIERFVEMAATRQDVDVIVVIIDLDDGCAKEMKEELERRCSEVSKSYSKPIEICFCIREFECWILQDIVGVSVETPEYGWKSVEEIMSPNNIRGAKERLQRHMTWHYKEVKDQETLARKIDLKRLFQVDRSFRKFVKSVSGQSYEQLNLIFE